MATPEVSKRAITELMGDLANARGGPDNITCLLARVLALPAPPEQPAALDDEDADEDADA